MYRCNMVGKAVFASAALAAGVSANAIPRSSSVSFESGIVAEAGGMHNVQISYNSPLDGPLSLQYGPCNATTEDDCQHTLGRTHVGAHPLAKRHASHPEQRPSKFVWLPPVNAQSGGCLHAFSASVSVGRSEPVSINTRKQRRWEAVDLPTTRNPTEADHISGC